MSMLASGSGTASMWPLRNSTLIAPAVAALVRARSSIPPAKSRPRHGRWDPPAGRMQDVDAAAGAEVQHHLTFVQVDDSSGVSGSRGWRGPRRIRELAEFGVVVSGCPETVGIQSGRCRTAIVVDAGPATLARLGVGHGERGRGLAGTSLFENRVGRRSLIAHDSSPSGGRPRLAGSACGGEEFADQGSDLGGPFLHQQVAHSRRESRPVRAGNVALEPPSRQAGGKCTSCSPHR